MPAPLCCVEKEFQAFRHRLSAHVLKDPVKVFCNSRCEDHALSQDLVTITLLRRSKAILDKFYIPNLFAWVRHQKLKQSLGITSDMVQLELFPTQSFTKVVYHCVERFQGGFSHSFKGQRKRRLDSHQQAKVLCSNNVSGAGPSTSFSRNTTSGGRSESGKRKLFQSVSTIDIFCVHNC